MFTHDVAVRIHDLTHVLAKGALQEALRIAVRDKADVVGIGFVGHAQSAPIRLGTHPRFIRRIA